MRIAIDPGHGGVDNGASANGIAEDAWALEFAQRLGHYVRKLGHETVFTRTTDRAVEISARAAIAVSRSCDVFVSIHCNAAGSTEADGAEVYYAPCGPYVGNSQGIAEQLLRVCQEAGLDSRGVKPDYQSQHKQLGVLRGTCASMPAVLLEVGFVTSRFDSKLQSNKYWREHLAERVAAVLVK